MTANIEALGLVKTYPGDVRALDGLGFAVEPGTVFGLLGPNGAGKSTTVKILTTLSRPDAGEARVAGVDVLREPARCAGGSASWPRARASTARRPAARTCVLQGEVHGLRGRERRRRVGRAARAVRAGRGRRPPRAHLLGRHAAAARHRDRPGAPARRCCSWTSPPPGSTPRSAPGCGTRSPRLAREERPDRPADHPLPRGGRPARPRLAIVDRGRSWPRARPTSSRASCTATPSTSSSSRAANGRRAAALARGRRRARGRRSTAAPCAPGSTDGADAVPAVLAALEARRGRRSPR